VAAIGIGATTPSSIQRVRGDRRRGDQRAAVLRHRRERHDVGVHAVLLHQHRRAGRRGAPLEQRRAQPGAGGVRDRSRSAGSWCGSPARIARLAARQRDQGQGIGRLGRLVDHDQREDSVAQRVMIGAGAGREQDRRGGQEVGLGLGQRGAGVALERAHLGPAIAGLGAAGGRARRGARRGRDRPAPGPGARRPRPAISASRLRASRAGAIRAGWPRRTTPTPAASRRSPRLSTAVFDGAVTSTRSTSWRPRGASPRPACGSCRCPAGRG
jgi:hypothetical protein